MGQKPLVMLALAMLMLERNRALPAHCSLPCDVTEWSSLARSPAVVATGTSGTGAVDAASPARLSVPGGSSKQSGLSRAHRVCLWAAAGKCPQPSSDQQAAQTNTAGVAPRHTTPLLLRASHQCPHPTQGRP